MKLWPFGWRYLDAPAGNTHTLKVPTPYGFPMWGVAETRKAPSNEGASIIFGAGKKERTLIPPQSGHIYLATGVPTRIDQDSERPREVKTVVCNHH